MTSSRMGRLYVDEARGRVALVTRSTHNGRFETWSSWRSSAHASCPSRPDSLSTVGWSSSAKTTRA
jgi:hypothetical protein